MGHSPLFAMISILVAAAIFSIHGYTLWYTQRQKKGYTFVALTLPDKFERVDL